ncbi:MAG: AAA family ATPase [Clostridia bacterium]|nr:AAA family ATPase [Clostridia bacterium]
MIIRKIVITGGPCAGKTTAMSWIQNNMPSRGYRVLFVPETATELIGGGVAPWTCGTNLDYQKCQVRLQKTKEELFEQAARTMPVDKVLIVCDRGMLDNKAYMTDAEFREALSSIGVSEVEMRDQYDAVFHLVTAAKGQEDAYAKSAVRVESIPQAIELDDKLLACWNGHPHLRVIDNSTDFEKKLERLLAEINAFLGEPELLEIERSYLIEYPDVEWLKHNPNCQRIEVVQTYLNPTQPGDERSIRQRGSDGHYIYFETIKRRIGNQQRVEIERRLTQDEYLGLMMEADPECRPIRKTRYCLSYNTQYFQIDLFPFWQDKAIAEVELRRADDEIRFPKELHIIREVTGDSAYSNASMARGLPPR